MICLVTAFKNNIKTKIMNTIFKFLEKVFVMPFYFMYVLLAIYVFIRELRKRDFTDVSVNGFDLENDESVKSMVSYLEPAIYALYTIFWGWLILKIIS